MSSRAAAATVFRAIGRTGVSAPLILLASLVWAGIASTEEATSDAPRLAVAPPAENDSPDGRPALTRDDLCELVEAAAGDHGIPVEFFTRLIWQESSFRIAAVSPKGAQGIAQFMPGTAAERGLADPFDPRQAIPASAGFLSALWTEFGNLGLAAAAYNAGPGRVADWLAGRRGLPAETRHFVAAITGRPAEHWSAPSAEDPQEDQAGAAEAEEKEEARTSCVTLVAALGTVRPQTVMPAAHAPWGVQVAGDFSQRGALSRYERLQASHPRLLGEMVPDVIGSRNRSRGTATFYNVRLPAQSRQQADELCRELRSAGGSCTVLRN